MPNINVFGVIFGCSLFCLTNLSFAQGLKLTSTDLSNSIPTSFTCDGKGLSPQLAWANLPPGTQSLIVIVADPDAPSKTFYHWGVMLPATASELPRGAGTNSKLTHTKNDFGKVGYSGPCPPRESKHRYVFELFALKAGIKHSPQLRASELAEMLRTQAKTLVIDSARLEATYAR